MADGPGRPGGENLLFLAGGIKKLRDKRVDLEAAAAELRTHELAVGNLISADGRSLNILAYLDWSKTPEGEIIPHINVRRSELVKGVRMVRDKWNDPASWSIAACVSFSALARAARAAYGI